MAMSGGLRGRYMGLVCPGMINFHTNPATFSIVHIIQIIIILLYNHNINHNNNIDHFYYYLGFVARISIEILSFGIRCTDFK